MEQLRVHRVRMGSIAVFGLAASVFVGLAVAAVIGLGWAFLDQLTLFGMVCDQLQMIGVVDPGGCPLLGVSVWRPALLAGGAVAVLGTVVTLLLAGAFNLIAELLGGVKVDVTRTSPSG